MINLYVYSSIRTPKNIDGIGIFILETETSKGPATLTKVMKFEDMNEYKAAILLVTEAFSRIKKPQPITLYTKQGYLVGLFEGERLEKWHENHWKGYQGKPVMHHEELEKLYEVKMPVEAVIKSTHSYSEWMKDKANKELEKWRNEKCSKDSENSTAVMK